MMSILVFLVILFGLFGVVSSQYMGQYREGYAIWIKEIVYNKSENNNKVELCSKIESLSREICWINDLLCGIILMIVFTFIVIIFTMYRVFPLLIEAPKENNILISCFVLTLMIFVAVPIIMKKILNIDILFDSNTSGIDRKLFSVWYKNKCFTNKNVDCQTKLEPHRLYELLAEKVKTGETTDCPNELIESLNERFGIKYIPYP